MGHAISMVGAGGKEVHGTEHMPWSQEIWPPLTSPGIHWLYGLGPDLKNHVDSRHWKSS